MEKEIEIQMSSKVLYEYMLHHTYTSMSGIMGTIVGLLFITAFFFKMGFIYLIAGVVITGYLPWSLFLRSKQQMITNKSFQKPLHYKFNEMGIEVSQDGAREMQSWDNMVKAISTNSSIIIYTSRINATILPKRQLAGELADVIHIISVNMPAEKVSIKG
ncbi:MAG: YcxB family protein [Eubacteriales bacterium]